MSMMAPIRRNVVAIALLLSLFTMGVIVFGDTHLANTKLTLAALVGPGMVALAGGLATKQVSVSGRPPLNVTVLTLIVGGLAIAMAVARFVEPALLTNSALDTFFTAVFGTSLGVAATFAQIDNNGD